MERRSMPLVYPRDLPLTLVLIAPGGRSWEALILARGAIPQAKRKPEEKLAKAFSTIRKGPDVNRISQKLHRKPPVSVFSCVQEVRYPIRFLCFSKALRACRSNCAHQLQQFRFCHIFCKTANSLHAGPASNISKANTGF